MEEETDSSTTMKLSSKKISVFVGHNQVELMVVRELVSSNERFRRRDFLAL